MYTYRHTCAHIHTHTPTHTHKATCVDADMYTLSYWLFFYAHDSEYKQRQTLVYMIYSAYVSLSKHCNLEILSPKTQDPKS